MLHLTYIGVRFRPLISLHQRFFKWSPNPFMHELEGVESYLDDILFTVSFDSCNDITSRWTDLYSLMFPIIQISVFDVTEIVSPSKDSTSALESLAPLVVSFIHQRT